MKRKEIYLAGGCFWGTEAFLKKINGVLETETGYANGNKINPTYKDVCHGSGHAEVVKVIYDSEKIELTKILNYFFKTINPVSINQQGADKGIQYRTGIYFVDKNDEKIIKVALDELQKSYELPLAIENKALENYASAEEYHQNYLYKNPDGYCHISFELINEILKNQ